MQHLQIWRFWLDHLISAGTRSPDAEIAALNKLWMWTFLYGFKLIETFFYFLSNTTPTNTHTRLSFLIFFSPGRNTLTTEHALTNNSLPVNIHLLCVRVMQCQAWFSLRTNLIYIKLFIIMSLFRSLLWFPPPYTLNVLPFFPFFLICVLQVKRYGGVIDVDCGGGGNLNLTNGRTH